jgi:hypothetical protein
MSDSTRTYQVTVTAPPVNARPEWEFTDSVGDRLTVTAEPDFGQVVTVHIRESGTSIAEAFVWFLPDTARGMAGALLAAADVVDRDPR